MDPILSICIPTFNRSTLLERLLLSILECGDSRPDVEIVVSDNASTDNTTDILKEYSSRLPNLRWSSSPKNRGFAENLLRVAGMARAQYCLWVGDDDLFIKGAIAYYVSQIRSNPDYNWYAINYWLAPQATIAGHSFSLESIPSGSWKNAIPNAATGPWRSWEEPLEKATGLDFQFYCAIFGCIWKRTPTHDSLLLIEPERRQMAENSEDGWTYSPEAYYPHTYAWMKALTGCPGLILTEPYYIQGTGTTRGDTIGETSFEKVTMPNLWMWVFPQIYRYALRNLNLSRSQISQLRHSLGYPCLRELQGRGLSKKKMFPNTRQAITYTASALPLFARFPIESVKVIKNLLPLQVIHLISKTKKRLLMSDR